MQDLRGLLREIENRKFVKELILSGCFPEQRKFVLDTSKRVSALTSRRSGKSTGLGYKLIHSALRYPNRKNLYIALTRNSAKSVMWNPILIDILDKSKIKYKPNNSELTITFPNKSEIILAGADAHQDIANKFRGNKYQLVILDEAQSFTIDLQQLLDDVLIPCTIDYQESQIILAGTPGLGENYFYYATTAPEYSKHTWNALNNPHIDKKFQEEIDRRKALGLENTPSFQREFLGLWVKDTSLLCYPSFTKHNLIQELPKDYSPDNPNYYTMLSIDFGFNDATSFVLSTYHKRFNTNLYILHAENHTKLIISDVVKKANNLINQYKPKQILGDGTKQILEEIRQRHNINIHFPDKTDKQYHMSMLENDFAEQIIKIHEPNCQVLIKELNELHWYKKSYPHEIKEDPSCQNHSTDNLLYLWKNSYNYLVKPKNKIIINRYDIERLEEVEEKKYLARNRNFYDE